jgi:hypothetical protein
VSDSAKEKYVQLIERLLQQKLISPPQVEIANADVEVTGMSLDEVLLARRWVTEETLHQVAPWLKQVPIPRSQPIESLPPTKLDGKQSNNLVTASGEFPLHTNGSDDFDENLRKYRVLMEKILGEANS